jgi:mRNA interferase RelE/StbE
MGRSRRDCKGRIETALLKLREDPRPPGEKRLVGHEGPMRIQVGDWRIIYEVREREVVVLVARVGPHGEVYERLG